jgi:PAS domain S-box-containing protein
MASVPKPERAEGEAGKGGVIRSADWSATAIGTPGTWPGSLRFAIQLLERSPVAAAIYWGADFHLFYNEAWAPVLGDRHPLAFGRAAADVWGPLWPGIRAQFEQVFETGEGLTVADQLLPVTRGGIEREAYWSYSLTPILAEDGRVGGILNQGMETTKALFAERRLSFQVAVADRLRGIDDPEEVKRAATELLGRYLGAARVGYAEIDPAQGLMSVRSDWTRDEGIQSLAGQCRQLAEMGPEAVAFLRTGETLALPDIRAIPTTGAERSAAWEEVGVRALIMVPLVREGELKALLYVHEPKPRSWRRSEAAMARDIAERTWAAVERAQAEQSLRDSEDHYRHTVELNPQVTWTALADGHLDRLSSRWQEWTGTSGLGDGWAEALHPDDREPTLEAWRRSVATGEPYDFEHRVRRVDGSYRWARSRAFPRHDSQGHVCLWYGSTEDIDKRRQAEERQRLLLHELNHRVKNTLATVQAIAFQTLKGEVSLGEARGRFEARLLALSRAHNLLTGQNWAGASLEQVVRDATDYLSRDRFEIEGETVWLAPRAAVAMALALHELGTNAVKYGALSGEHGTVSIRWSVEARTLRMTWKERGGPEVVQPERRGFGSRLIEKGLATDLDGSAELRFEPDGLRCVIGASCDSIGARERALG